MALSRGRQLLCLISRNQNKLNNFLNKEQRLAPVKIFSCEFNNAKFADGGEFDQYATTTRQFEGNFRSKEQRYGGRKSEKAFTLGHIHEQVQKQEIPDLVKNTYIESQITAERSQEEVQEFLSEYNIIVKGQNVPKPILTLEETRFADNVKILMANKGMEKPFPIQSMTWPVVMSGKDCVGIAQTGSGKTLAYILPALYHIVKNKPKQYGEGPRVVVMVPTRELAVQVKEVCEIFAGPANVQTALAYGGVSKGNQLSKIRESEFLIATPGRLNDFLSSGEFDLKRCTYLVLDEADRMLDMGFEPQIRSIVNHISATNRQTVMWSATWPLEIRSLANEFLNQPVNITVGDKELKANPQIEQHVYCVSEHQKAQKLVEILNEIATDPIGSKTLIFANRKRTTEVLQRNLSEKGLPALCIHGDYQQQARDRAVKVFRERSKVIMIATDVVARGIDISDIAHVINYDMPADIENYIHRIGRTARADRKGKSHTFITTADHSQLKKLIRIMEDAGQHVDHDLRAISVSYGQRSLKGLRRRPTFDNVQDIWKD